MANEARTKNALFGGGQVTGGITYSTPAFSLGAWNGAAPNGGLTFDLPLATVQSFTQQALSFSANNSKNAQGFLGAVYANAQSNVNQATNRAFSFGDTSLNAIVNMASEQQRQLTARNDSGGCFITTAVCESEGKPDNCDELETLRAFRDGPLREMAEGCDLIAQYYAEAPGIVEKIDSMSNRQVVYDFLLSRYIVPAVLFVKRGEHQAAKDVYMAMVRMCRFIVAEE